MKHKIIKLTFFIITMTVIVLFATLCMWAISRTMVDFLRMLGPLPDEVLYFFSGMCFMAWVMIIREAIAIVFKETKDL